MNTETLSETTNSKDLKNENHTQVVFNYIIFFGVNHHLIYENNSESIHVYINGNPLSLSAKPIIQDGRMLIPLRGVFEELGAVVKWMPAEFIIEITKDNIYIMMKSGSNQIKVNEKTYSLDTSPNIKDGVTYVPLRFVSEMLGSKVKWVKDTNSAHILTYDISTAT
ncbi:copper amine oxidase N-terminal domain-containing protein [Paenibacillus sp. FA6]|uniref:copper amine oxidase N-terminal domain-containing protein n=1 Tax=Paenibacillus sp. FA6 TaxID=3413029 RepID=UPI003F65C919